MENGKRKNSFLGSRLSQEKGDCYERFSPQKKYTQSNKPNHQATLKVEKLKFLPTILQKNIALKKTGKSSPSLLTTTTLNSQIKKKKKDIQENTTKPSPPSSNLSSNPQLLPPPDPPTSPNQQSPGATPTPWAGALHLCPWAWFLGSS